MSAHSSVITVHQHQHNNIIMPGVITVPDFIREAREDFASPTTSTFVTRIPQCRETINRIDEVETVPYNYSVVTSPELGHSPALTV